MALARLTESFPYFLLAAAPAALLLPPCRLGGPSGNYVSERNSNDILELKSDKTSTVSLDRRVRAASPGCLRKRGAAMVWVVDCDTSMVSWA